MKHGQASMFMILGIIILVLGVLIYFVQNTVLENQLEPNLEQPGAVDKPEIQAFVDRCLEQSLLQGLEIMRLQGGYIDIPTDTPFLLVDNDQNKQVALVDGRKNVITIENAQNTVPYWITADSIAIPSLGFMEQELADYIADDVTLCLNDFTSFKEQGFAVEYSPLTVTVSMARAVSATLSMILTAQKGETTFEDDTFVSTVPINMQQIQERAADLVALESFYGYAEEHTKTVISLYSGVDENKLPPFLATITNMDCSSTTWNKGAVESRLQDTLQATVPLLTVSGTQNDFPPNIDELYEMFEYDLFEEPQPELIVEFNYEKSWGFQKFDVVPRYGNTISPEQITGTNIPLVSQICVFKYPFKYTVQYPILATITDTVSARVDSDVGAYYENEGFVFQFPLQAHLCGNQNRECTSLPTTSLSPDFFAFEGKQLAEPLFCKRDQWLSDEITIEVLEDATGEGIEGATVRYNCGSAQNSCIIGQTNADGQLTSTFPLCVNGYLSVLKNGYASHESLFTVHENYETVRSVRLPSTNEQAVTVKKVFASDIVLAAYENILFDVSKQAYELIEGEQAILISDAGTFYVYPDAENRPLALQPGQQTLTFQLTSDITILDTTISGQEYEGFTGSYQTGFFSYPVSISQNDAQKSSVELFVLTEYDATLLQSGTWNDIDDPITAANGNLEAELLYRCERIDSTCSDTCTVVAIDGRNTIDFEDDEDNCEEAVQVTVERSTYLPLLQPLFT